MSDAELIQRLTSDVLERHCTPAVVSAAAGDWAPELWAALDKVGITQIVSGAGEGGADGGWVTIAAVLRMIGAYAAPVPIAETILAGRLLRSAGLSVPPGPLTVGQLDGTSARRVPWARAAATIVIVDPPDRAHRVFAIPRSACRITAGLNFAREPRDTVELDARTMGSFPHAELPNDSYALEGALCRTVEIAGAMGRVSGMTFEFAAARQQFGRPIARFQAIQQQLAILATRTAACATAASAAVTAVDAAGAHRCRVEIAAAKIAAGVAASEGARIAHQVHGAIGVTFEHQLHHFTSRLWSWRDEFGGEREWAVALGREVSGSGAAYWDRITR